MALPFGDPRKRWWTLMGGGKGAPIPSRFGQAAYEQAFQKDKEGPNYEIFDDESGGWSAAKNNAAINAAMASGTSAPYAIGPEGYTIINPGVGDRIKKSGMGYSPSMGGIPSLGGMPGFTPAGGSSMIKDIADALKDLKPGPDAPELAGGKFGRAKPSALGFSLPSMGGRLGEQEAMAKARREEELRRRMKLMGGGY